MQKLFTYGTLKDPETQMQLLGRTLGEGVADTLRGYRLAKLTGIHYVYTIIQPWAGGTVDGLVFDIGEDELTQLDEYEGDAYQRVSARTVSKTRAWVYVANPKSKFRHHIEPFEDA